MSVLLSHSVTLITAALTDPLHSAPCFARFPKVEWSCVLWTPHKQSTGPIALWRRHWSGITVSARRHRDMPVLDMSDRHRMPRQIADIFHTLSQPQLKHNLSLNCSVVGFDMKISLHTPLRGAKLWQLGSLLNHCLSSTCSMSAIS